MCPGPPSSVHHMCSYRGAATYGYCRDDSVVRTHAHIQSQHRVAEQPPAEPKEKLKIASTDHSDGSVLTYRLIETSKVFGCFVLGT